MRDPIRRPDVAPRCARVGRLLAIVVTAVIAGSLSGQSKRTQTYTHTGLGITIELPADWL